MNVWNGIGGRVQQKKEVEGRLVKAETRASRRHLRSIYLRAILMVIFLSLIFSSLRVNICRQFSEEGSLTYITRAWLEADEAILIP